MDDPVRLLSELFLAKQRAVLEDIHVSMPGRIVSYDRAKQKASVQPLVRRGFVGLTGERENELLPVVTGVPVEFFGGGGFSLTFPVAVGMTCRLAVMSVSLDRWLARGGEVDPSDDRKCALSDSVAVLGLRDFAHALTGLPSDAWVMATPNGTHIKLGSTTASQQALKGNAFLSSVITFVKAIGSAAAASDGLPPAITAYNILANAAEAAFNVASATFLSSRVKLE